MKFEAFKKENEAQLKGIEFREKGEDLFDMYSGKIDKDTKKIINPILVSKTPFFVKKVIIDSDSNDMFITLSIWKKERVFNYRLSTSILANGNTLKTALFTKGIFVENINSVITLLQEQETNCTNVHYETQKVGFSTDPDNKNQIFITPNNGCISCSGVDIRYSLQQPTLKTAMTSKGSLSKWVEAIDILKLSNERASIPFLLASSILPLFAKIYPDFNGFLVNIIPDPSLKDTSSTGKTTLLKLMLSFQTSSKWMGTWDTTEMAIESKLHENFGAYLDDLSTNRNIESFENIIYSIANGVSRMRLDNKGVAKETKNRRVVLYSTGEESIVDSNSIKDGAFVRFLEVPLLPSDLGSDDLSETAHISETIKDITQHNYGFIYPKVIELLLKNKSDVNQKINKYTKEYKLSAKTSMWKRLAKTYALTAVAGELFIDVMREIKKDKTYLKELNYFELSKGMFIDRVNFLEKIEDPNMEALELIRDNIIIKEDNVYDKEEKNIIGIVKQDMVCIKTTEVNNIIIVIKNLNTTKFIQWCISKKFIVKTNKDRSELKATVNGKKSVNTYAFDLDKIAPTISETLKSVVFF